MVPVYVWRPPDAPSVLDALAVAVAPPSVVTTSTTSSEATSDRLNQFLFPMVAMTNDDPETHRRQRPLRRQRRQPTASRSSRAAARCSLSHHWRQTTAAR